MKNLVRTHTIKTNQYTEEHPHSHIQQTNTHTQQKIKHWTIAKKKNIKTMTSTTTTTVALIIDNNNNNEK